MRVLVLGAKGMLGQEIVRQGTVEWAWDKEEVDLLAPLAREKILAIAPEVIINCVAYNAVDEAETPAGREWAEKLNGAVPALLAAVSKELGATLVHFSSDYVFAGDNPAGYDEAAMPAPGNAYGHSKLLGEQAVLQSGARVYLVRLSRLFGMPAQGAGAKKSFVDTLLDLAAAGQQQFDLVHAEKSSPTYAVDLAGAVWNMLATAPPGIYHLTNTGHCTWHEFGQEIFRQTGQAVACRPVAAEHLPRPAARPAQAVLLNTKRPPLRPWDVALGVYLKTRTAPPDLSLITVGYKSRDYVRALLNSLLAARANLRLEYFLLDNASGDGLLDMVRQEFLPRADADLHFHLIQNERNLGFAAANNIGLRRARGRYVLLLNPDMELLPDTLLQAVRWAEANPQAAVVGVKLITPRGQTIPHIRRFPTISDQLAVTSKLSRLWPAVLNKYLCADFDYERAQAVDSVRGAFFLLPRATVDKIPQMDENYFLWFEEVDYCRQVVAAGQEVWYTPAATAVDQVGRSFALVPVGKKQQYFSASMLHYFAKWHPRWRGLLWLAWQPWLFISRWWK